MGLTSMGLTMTDRVSRATRSRMMSGIKVQNTKPERLIRQLLFARGFRYRLHVSSLPGKPDLVFPRYRAVVFVHGCFWHGHQCHLFKLPKTRRTFWSQKIDQNVSRDQRQIRELWAMGWRVGTIWECALRGRSRLSPGLVAEVCEVWLQGEEAHLDLAGQKFP